MLVPTLYNGFLENSVVATLRLCTNSTGKKKKTGRTRAGKWTVPVVLNFLFLTSSYSPQLHPLRINNYSSFPQTLCNSSHYESHGFHNSFLSLSALLLLELPQIRLFIFFLKYSNHHSYHFGACVNLLCHINVMCVTVCCVNFCSHLLKTVKKILSYMKFCNLLNKLCLLHESKSVYA